MKICSRRVAKIVARAFACGFVLCQFVRGEAATSCSSYTPPTATSCTYFTASTGDDSHPGTASQPFLTIVKGASVLQPGQTLCVRGGTYAEELSGLDSKKTTVSGTITISASAFDDVGVTNYQVGFE
jgi:hypothetical protein